MYSWHPSKVLNTPQCTYDIPLMYWIPPNVLNIFWCTEHPHMYWTSSNVLNHIIQGETIQILILRPKCKWAGIPSTLTFVTGLLHACLFWKTTVVEINFYPNYVYLWAIRESIPSQWGNAIQSSQIPKELMVIFLCNQWDFTWELNSFLIQSHIN